MGWANDDWVKKLNQYSCPKVWNNWGFVNFHPNIHNSIGFNSSLIVSLITCLGVTSPLLNRYRLPKCKVRITDERILHNSPNLNFQLPYNEVLPSSLETLIHELLYHGLVFVKDIAYQFACHHSFSSHLLFIWALTLAHFQMIPITLQRRRNILLHHPRGCNISFIRTMAYFPMLKHGFIQFKIMIKTASIRMTLV